MTQNWSLWNLESRRFYSHVQIRAAKWHLFASLVVGQCTPGNPRAAPHTSGSETQCNGPVCRSSSPTQRRAKGQCLASPCGPNRLNTNTRIVQSSSCALTLNSHLSKICLIPPLGSGIFKNVQAKLPLDHADITSASGAWPARTKPGKAGLLLLGELLTSHPSASGA